MRKALEGEDGAALTAAVDQLIAVQSKAAEALYRQTAASGGPEGGAGGPGAPGSPVEGEVIDAEVVDEK